MYNERKKNIVGLVYAISQSFVRRNRLFFLYIDFFFAKEKSKTSKKVTNKERKWVSKKKTTGIITFVIETLKIVAPLWHDFMLNGLELEWMIIIIIECYVALCDSTNEDLLRSSTLYFFFRDIFFV